MLLICCSVVTEATQDRWGDFLILTLCTVVFNSRAILTLIDLVDQLILSKATNEHSKAIY